MQNISIIGCGLIGRGWAIVFARAGFKVTIFDQETSSLETALKSIGASMSSLHELKLLPDDPETLCNNISCATNLRHAVAHADYVQESITEDLNAKKHLFKELDHLAKPKCILASSTSTISTSSFSGDLKGKDRCIVAHPLNPPHLIPLVEISPAPYTNKSVVEETMLLHNTANQTPILVQKEIEGFILNRLQAALLLESWQLVKEGYVSVSDLDKTVKNGLGHRWAFMGPFETTDLNAKKGISEYAQIFGEAYRKMMKNSEYAKWDDNLINRVNAVCRDITSEENIEQRSQWRDFQLMELLLHKQLMRDKLGE